MGDPPATDTTVAVTGATGFIAQHCVLQLLEAGWRVRGTARSAARDREIRDALRPHLTDPSALDRYETTAVDLEIDAGWDDALAGCRFVLHVASPIPRTPPKHEDELIRPARDGSLRVLRAAARTGVERVVLTSSVAAVLYGVPRDKVFTEADWSDVDGKTIGAYEKSKTIAERAAWDYMRSGDAGSMELAVINPGLVLGPVMSADWGTSGEVVKKLFDRDFPACPDINFAVVDVRDVATAHLAAMTAPEAAGQRFICAIDNASLRDIARILDRHYGPQGFKIPTGHLPSPLMRVVALWDKTARLALNDLGRQQNVDSSRIRAVLGWQPHTLEEMVVAMADSFLEYGVVTRKR